MEAAIFYFAEGIDFELQQQAQISTWLKDIVSSNGREIESLNYIFVSDEGLYTINKTYLNHDTYTDIITFPLHEGEDDALTGDIFISVDRVRENAAEFSASFEDELHRVMVHGVLHMLGHSDLDDESEAEMRKAEDFALSLRRF